MRISEHKMRIPDRTRCGGVPIMSYCSDLYIRMYVTLAGYIGVKHRSIPLCGEQCVVNLSKRKLRWRLLTPCRGLRRILAESGGIRQTVHHSSNILATSGVLEFHQAPNRALSVRNEHTDEPSRDLDDVQKLLHQYTNITLQQT